MAQVLWSLVYICGQITSLLALWFDYMLCIQGFLAEPLQTLFFLLFFRQCYSTRVAVSSLDSRPLLLSQDIQNLIKIVVLLFSHQCYSTRVTISSLDSRPWLLSQGIHATRHAMYVFASSVQVLQARWSITKSGECAAIFKSNLAPF